MNVTCDKCNKRYSIADDKVRGKSVKIRCKQCQNLISVQGPASGAVASVAAAPSGGMAVGGGQQLGGQALGGQWEEERTRTMPILDNTAQWFAMVKGTQLGPFDLRGLEGKVKTGELTLRTYLWRQGMGDWKRASDVPEVSPVFAGVSMGGATATGPTTAAPPPLRPPSTRAPAVQRDVVLANESPSPEVTGRKNGNGNGSGNGHGAVARTDESPMHQPPARPVSQPKVAPVARPPSQAKLPAVARPVTPEPSPTAPAPTTTEPVMPQAEAPLSDLFKESQPDLPAVDPGSVPLTMDEGKPAAAVDPFDALGPADPAMAPAIGEATKFFIAQSGANNRNPWWKILLVAVGAPAAILGVLFVLSTLGIAPLEVTRTNEKGEEVKESFFSSNGVSGLKDMLSGEAKKKKAEAEKEKARLAALAAAEQPKPKAHPRAEAQGGETPEKPEKPATPSAELALIYGNSGDSTKVDKGPRVRTGEGDEGPKPTDTSKGLSVEATQKVINDKLKAFEGCIVDALHRNPNLAVGPIEVVANVAQSGVVTSASIAPAKWENSDWGGCMRDVAKRIVFPKSDGESEVRIPLKVGVSAL